MHGFPILSLLIFLPLAGALLLLLLPAGRTLLVRRVALAVTVTAFLASLPLPGSGGKAKLAFVEDVAWVPRLGIRWHLGIDGFSMPLILLTCLLGPIVVLGAWEAVRERHRAFFALLLALQAFVTGTLCARNLAVFYVFWELMLVPMFFVIGLWGGRQRVYATLKFVLYTVAGSMLMLAAILYLYWLHHEQHGAWSLELHDLARVSMGLHVQELLFAAFALALAIKVPLWPLHTWLPDAHVEAPTAGSVVLASVLLKMGAYGFLCLGVPLFPAAARQWGWLLMLLAAAGIAHGALVAIVQPDIKKLVAFTSVSHMGYVVLGIFALNEQGATGAMVQMLSHGLATGALFLLVGMIYERTHTRRVWDFGGLARVMPVYAAFFVAVSLVSMGLPGTTGFIGEFLSLLGAFRWGFAHHQGGAGLLPSFGYVAVGAAGVVIGTATLLWTIERIFFGPVLQERHMGLPDLGRREVAVLLPLVVLALALGVYPRPLIERIEPTVQEWLLDAEAGAARTAALPPWFGMPGTGRAAGPAMAAAEAAP